MQAECEGEQRHGADSLRARLLGAIALIEKSSGFEGDGDLAAADLALRDVLSELGDRNGWPSGALAY